MKTISRFDRFVGCLLSFLLSFSVMMDPTDLWFHMKVPLFVLYFLYNLKSRKISNVFIPILFFTIYFVTLAFQQLTYTGLVDWEVTIAIFKSFLFVLLIISLSENNKTQLFRSFFIVILIQSTFCVFLDIMLRVDRNLAIKIVYSFPNTTDAANYNFAIMHRGFIGLDWWGIYYKTSPLVTIPLAISLYIALFYKHRKYFVYSIIMLLFLFFTSTRANVLAALLIPSVMLIYYLFKKKRFVLMLVLLCSFGTVGMILLFKFLGDSDDFSMNIKTLHQISYWDIFDAHPFRYIFVGEGPGALFFTKAINAYWANTELSYYDLIRNYGLLFTTVIILLFLYPSIKTFYKQEKKLAIAVLLGYGCYLIIAATNPYLVSSTGFFMYTLVFYISKIDIRKELNLGKVYTKYRKSNKNLSYFFKWHSQEAVIR